jgi:phytoene dehydrogenase-like protein
MGKFAGFMGRLNRQAIPRINPDDYGDLWGLGKIALSLRLMGKKDMENFLRLAAINVYDLMEEYFEHPMLKGVLAFDAVLGTFLGTRSNNSVYTALQRASNSGGASAVPGLPQGGMGAVTAALAAAAEANGAELRTSSPVGSIVMDAGRATGVVLEDGSQIDAACVVSNADPKKTFLSLVGARNIEAGLVKKITNIRARGNAAKLHLALNGKPAFRGLDDSQLGQRLVVAPSMEYIEQAFNHAKYGEYSESPAMEITLPSIADSSLAPAGKHVLSAVVQYAPLDLKRPTPREFPSRLSTVSC